MTTLQTVAACLTPAFVVGGYCVGLSIKGVIAEFRERRENVLNLDQFWYTGHAGRGAAK